MYLKCSSNNEAGTVLSLFATAVLEHGVPCHVRTDLAGEVWQYMIDQHSSTSAVMCFDVYLYETFHLLMSEGKLDPSNVHFVYIPQLMIITPLRLLTI